QPTVGGSAPGKTRGVPTPGFPDGNPQVGDAPTAAQLQAVSSFISATGPVRESRFPKGAAGDDSSHRDPVLAVAVANLFVIRGRPVAWARCDRRRCSLATRSCTTNSNGCDVGRADVASARANSTAVADEWKRALHLKASLYGWSSAAGGSLNSRANGRRS